MRPEAALNPDQATAATSAATNIKVANPWRSEAPIRSLEPSGSPNSVVRPSCGTNLKSKLVSVPRPISLLCTVRW